MTRPSVTQPCSSYGTVTALENDRAVPQGQPGWQQGCCYLHSTCAESCFSFPVPQLTLAVGLMNPLALIDNEVAFGKLQVGLQYPELPGWDLLCPGALLLRKRRHIQDRLGGFVTATDCCI